MSQIIRLTKGFVTEVDDVDAFYLCLFLWTYCKGYAARSEKNSKRTIISMHSVVADRMGLIGQIDHKDQNKLNNKRENLRLATRSQNGANSGLQSNNTSGFKGVHWCPYHGKWRSTICINKRTIHLGYNEDRIEAAKLYDRAAKHYFGAYCSLNLQEIDP